LSAQQAHDEVLDAEDVLGKRIVPTRLRGNVTIREAQATAAPEVMSRLAANPKWLIYLPPTMSPCETSNEPGLLEHPAEAFACYRSQGAPNLGESFLGFAMRMPPDHQSISTLPRARFSRRSTKWTLQSSCS
jgi:hypothetical protein